MPMVTISMMEGRSKAQKDAVAWRISEAMEQEMGVPPEALWLRFEDVSPDEWYVGPSSTADRRKAREGS